MKDRIVSLSAMIFLMRFKNDERERKEWENSLDFCLANTQQSFQNKIHPLKNRQTKKV